MELYCLWLFTPPCSLNSDSQPNPPTFCYAAVLTEHVLLAVVEGAIKWLPIGRLMSLLQHMPAISLA